jgi:hypothetical protein
MAEEPVYKSLGIEDKTVMGERSITEHMSGIIKAPYRFVVEKGTPVKSKDPVENLTQGKRDEYNAFMTKNISLRKDDQELLLKKKFENVPSDAELSTETEYYGFVHNSINSYIQYLGNYKNKGAVHQPTYEAFIDTQTGQADRYYFTDMQNSEISSVNDIYTLKADQVLTENDRAIMKPYVYKADYQRKGGKRATKKLRRKRAMKKSRRAYKHKSKKMRRSRTTRKRRS